MWINVIILLVLEGDKVYQALYRKYRPKNLNEVWGQDTIVKIINNSIENNKISHAYLFAGPRGTGKTSIAKIFAAMVNCENLQNGILCGKCPSCSQENNTDIIEIDAASNNGVDEIRELRNKVNLVPSYGKYKIYIIDEVHMLTTGAFNALLKTLEEPPSHVIFVLATTDPHKIPETILSRCQRLDFKKISENNIVNRLKQIAEAEKIEIDDDSLYEIARLSDGGMRDSIGMLDQAVAYAEKQIKLQDIHDINGTLTQKDLKELILLVQEKNVEKIFEKIDLYNDNGKNFVKLTEELIGFLRNVLIFKEATKYFKNQHKNIEVYNDLSQKITTNQILKYIKELNECTQDMYRSNNTKLLLELTIIKLINAQNVEKTSEKIKDKEETEEKIEKNPKIMNKNTNTQIDNNNLIKTSKEKTVEKPKKNDMIDLELLNHIKNVRIDNTLSRFNKKVSRAISEQLDILNSYLLDPDLSKYASIILDGTLKAASEENLIFVFSSENTAKLFNSNILEIENVLNKALNNQYKVIATDADHWEKIKNEFNSKRRAYNYQKEDFDIQMLQSTNKNEFSEFEDIIEYQ